MSTAQRYRKKPVEVEAVRVNDAIEAAKHAWSELPTWFADAYENGDVIFTDDRVEITTLEGRMTAGPMDYIIRGVKGELYPCKPDIFEATYEAAD
jgi:hypothetical protein